MNDVTTDQAPEPPAQPDPERDEEQPSPEMADALADYEKGKAHATAAEGAATTLTKGAKVRCKVVSVGEDAVLVDYGGRSEAAVEVRHFRNDDGSLRAQPGDELELFVVEDGDPPVLAPSIKADTKGDALK